MTTDPRGDEKAIANFRKGYSATNRDTACQFLDHLHVRGLAPATRRHYASTLARLDQYLNGRPFAEACGNDLQGFLLAEGQRVTQQSVAICSNLTAAFLRWLTPSGDLPRDLTLALKVGQPRNLSQKRPIEPSEFDALLEGAGDLRMQALLWTLWDSGFRIGEALSLRVGDIELDSKGGARLRLPPQAQAAFRLKTGPRTVYVVDCVAILKSWLAVHPEAGKSKAPLFPSRQQANRGGPLSPVAVYNRLRTLTTRLSLRHVTPHLFRHTRATRAARAGWSEAAMRQYFGWARDSDMPSVYIHLVAADQEAQVRREAGVDESGHQTPQAMTDADVDQALKRLLKRAMADE